MSAGIYNRLGTQLEFSGLPAKLGAHALVGGLIAELAGGDFRTGALAAGANEAFVSSVGDKIFNDGMHDQLLAMTSQLIGLTVAAAAGGSDKDQAVAGWVASQATKYNSLDHPTAEKLLTDLSGCRASNSCSEAKIRGLIAQYEQISADRSALLASCPTSGCRDDIKANTISMDDPVAKELLSFFRNSISYDMVGLLTGDPSKVAIPSQGKDKWGSTFVTDDQIILAANIKQGTLSVDQKAYLDQWNKQMSWMDNAAGRVLSISEKADLLISLGNTMLTEGWGRISSGNGAGKLSGTSLDAPGFGSVLADASKAAYRAADTIEDFIPKDKHLLGGGSQSKARFNTSDVGETQAIIQEALRSPNAVFLPNANIPGTFRVVADLGREIGVKGQKAVRVIVGMDGKVINAFPVHER
jgi:filamentous hemagglutinin